MVPKNHIPKNHTVRKIPFSSKNELMYICVILRACALAGALKHANLLSVIIQKVVYQTERNKAESENNSTIL